MTWARLVTYAFLPLIALGLFFRFFQLSAIPVALYHDEMDYAFTGEAVARYGTDIAGTWTPFQLKPLHTLNYTAETPAIWHAMVQKIIGYGPSSVHAPSALFGIGSIMVIAVLTYVSTKNRLLVLATVAMLLANPWFIQVSRMGYEAIFALFFELVFVALVYVTSQRKKLTFSQSFLLLIGMAISVALGYFSYHGAKFTVLALLGGAVLWFLAQKMEVNKKIVLIGTLGLIAVSLLFHTISMQRAGMFGNRQQEVINTDHLANGVNFLRGTSVVIPGQNLFFNKAFVVFDHLTSHFMFVFDVYRLFVSGFESGFQFSLIVHGFFYLSSLPLIFLGVSYLYQKHRQYGIFLLLVLLISPTASMISMSNQAVFRSALTYVILLTFVGAGAVMVVEYVEKKKWREMLLGIFMCLMLGEAVRFGVAYFSRYPIVSSENQYIFDKLLAGYVQRPNQPILVITNRDAYSRARAIVAYNQWMPLLSEGEKKQFADPARRTFVIKNVTVSQDCFDISSLQNTVQVVDAGLFERCKYPQFLATASAQIKDKSGQIKLSAISSPIDSGGYYFLINDPICKSYQLPEFVAPKLLRLFDVNVLSNQDYCENWVKSEVKGIN